MNRTILQAISGIALAGTILPPALFMTGRMELNAAQWWMLGATLAWFVVTPLWMGRPKVDEELVL